MMNSTTALRPLARLCAALSLGALLFTGCAGSPQSDAARLQRKLNQACYEVVVERPAGPDPLIYEKPLPWDRLPLALRTDAYYSIGTAFAVDRERLVSAAHVFDFADNSPMASRLFVRNAAGDVFRITQVEALDNRRDYVVFRAEGLVNPDWFAPAKTAAPNTPVYAVGNIYGQGLVAVPGTLLASQPEPRNGAWQLLKNSPANDHGSSGGPLVNPDLEVLGVLLQKDQSFSWSLPFNELRLDKPAAMRWESDFRFSFALVLEDKSDIWTNAVELALPAEQTEIRKRIAAGYEGFYAKNMEAFLAGVEGGVFPDGPNARQALYESFNTGAAEVVYRDGNDRQWKYSSIKKTTAALHDSGTLLHATLGGLTMVDLVKPETISHAELYSDPALIMRLMLEGINVPRTLAGQNTRILSFGQPAHNAFHTDRWGRRWISAEWDIPYSNEVALLLAAPVPSGAVCLIKVTGRSVVNEWRYDLQRFCDFVYVPYVGPVREWLSFLAQKQYLSGMFQNTSLTLGEAGLLVLKSDSVDMRLDGEFMSVGPDAGLALLHGFTPNAEGQARWVLRKVLYSNPDGDEYFTSFRVVKPHSALGERAQKAWNAVAKREYPYAGQAFSSAGKTEIGSLHPTAPADGQSLYTIFLQRKGQVEQAAMQNGLAQIAVRLTWKP